ncbi:MAG: DUF1517 domain-containing protein [Cyanobacteriota bacterium]|nr:DUF1517 domain-containing protein [Cyanobacteriota bacterium]
MARSFRSPLRRLMRLLSLSLLPLLAASLFTLVAPQPAQAASGGRIGGGSFRSSSPSFRGGSYGGGSYGGGSYGGRYGGGYGGGGFGFPFLLPIGFGFGGAGLFGFLILMAVVGVLLNGLRGAMGGGESMGLPAQAGDGPVSVAQMQLGLLATARDLQQDLRRSARTADTGSNAGLQQVLQDTTLALLRHPDQWVYANSEVGQVPFTAAEATFNRLSMAERSKLSSEVTTNVDGRRRAEADATVQAGDADATNDFIAVTLLVASRRPIPLKPVDSADQLREALRVLGAVPSSDLLALEVIWQPDAQGDVLEAGELLTAYPQLKHL